MNILVDKLPNDYEGLKINTNFRSFILFELLMQDKGIEKEDKIILALNLFFEEVPKDITNVPELTVHSCVWSFQNAKSFLLSSNSTFCFSPALRATFFTDFNSFINHLLE